MPRNINFNHHEILQRLKEFQKKVRSLLIESRQAINLHAVDRDTSADTIYAIDAVVEPVLEDFCRDWAKTTPLVLIAEGIEGGVREGVKVFPNGSREEDAYMRLIVDPIDGTRGLMYDKRAAWMLAGVAPNKGPATSLRDIEVAIMTELPTSKMGFADVIWAIKGTGARGERFELATGKSLPLLLAPSNATALNHGFASVSNFFPGTKKLASELMEFIARGDLGTIDVRRASIFDDQYISTGGQFYELIVGHDRFIADLRPIFYRIQNQPEGLCCHPYDCAALLIAEETGVIVTDGLGQPLNGPLDVTTGLSWAGFANGALQKRIEPVLARFFSEHGIIAQPR